jgi:hypothetical protein
VKFREKFGQAYVQKAICSEMWTAPQVNFDGKVVGCCVNYWDDFGNAFTDGLLKVLNNERMRYARLMLLGKAPERADIACTTCKFYQAMKEDGSWIQRKDIRTQPSRVYAAICSMIPKKVRQAVRRFISAYSQK